MVNYNTFLHGYNLEVKADGKCSPMGSPPATLGQFPLRHPYRFYRFLCDLDDLVESVSDDLERIRIAAVLTRHFLTQATWITETCPVPDQDQRVAGKSLYGEPGYPFIIQVVAWLPQRSPVHNHANWSIVGYLGDEMAGCEHNSFWCRQDDGLKKGHAIIKKASQQILKPGDIIGFTPDAIHSIVSIPCEKGIDSKPTYTFNIFGETDFSQRYEFDPLNNTLKKF
ncbi:MAG: cupin [Coleofasciculus sp. C1-SOL-03]|uniref:cupin n=1 Tax=Coleofasciculus sp. C1-SOL-03 TaxID=3069522 RepID=UPI0032F3CC94